MYPGQIDPGFAFIEWLERRGLAWNVQTPDTLPRRPGITAVAPAAESALAPARSNLDDYAMRGEGR